MHIPPLSILTVVSALTHRTSSNVWTMRVSGQLQSNVAGSFAQSILRCARVASEDAEAPVGRWQDQLTHRFFTFLVDSNCVSQGEKAECMYSSMVQPTR